MRTTITLAAVCFLSVSLNAACIGSPNCTVNAAGGGGYTTIQACATAMAAGDTCTVYAGTYSENVTVSSGTAGNYKTFNVNGTDVVTVLSFTLGSYNKVIGFHIQNPSSPNTTHCITIAGAATSVYITNNVISQCGQGNSGGGGMIISNNGTGADHVFIQGNTISYGCGTPASPDACVGMYLFGDHYLVENNDMSHVLFGVDVAASYTVVRNNTLHDLNQSECATNPACHMDFIFMEPGPTFVVKHNLWEDNIGRGGNGTDNHALLTQADGCAGQCSDAIIRFNIMSHVGSGGLVNDKSFPHVLSYNNSWIDMSNNSATQLYGSTMSWANSSTNGAEINNLFYYPESLTDFNPYYADATSVATFSVGHNLGWCTGATCNIHGKVYGSGLFTDDPGNIKADPLLTNYAGNDFGLASGSPALAAGTFLTTVAATDSGSGTSLVVNDASFFQDGFSLTGVNGDCVSITTVGNHICVTAVNYSTNTLTLASSTSRSSGDSIWLYSDSTGRQVLTGTAPNIGATFAGTAITHHHGHWKGAVQ